MVGLIEDRAHERGDGLRGGARHRRQQVAHEVHAASLPLGAAQDLGDGAPESLVGVGHDQAHALESPLDQAS